MAPTSSVSGRRCAGGRWRDHGIAARAAHVDPPQALAAVTPLALRRGCRRSGLRIGCRGSWQTETGWKSGLLVAGGGQRGQVDARDVGLLARVAGARARRLPAPPAPGHGYEDHAGVVGHDQVAGLTGILAIWTVPLIWPRSRHLPVIGVGPRDQIGKPSSCEASGSRWPPSTMAPAQPPRLATAADWPPRFDTPGNPSMTTTSPGSARLQASCSPIMPLPLAAAAATLSVRGTLRTVTAWPTRRRPAAWAPAPTPAPRLEPELVQRIRRRRRSGLPARRSAAAGRGPGAAATAGVWRRRHAAGEGFAGHGHPGREARRSAGWHAGGRAGWSLPFFHAIPDTVILNKILIVGL